MSAIDWQSIFQKYKGLWVALDEDEQTVLGSGKTLKEAQKDAKTKGHLNPILTRMPDDLVRI